MKDLIIYVHGKGGSAQEAEHYKTLFPNDEVIGFDYRSQTPWESKKEFFAFFAEKKKQCKHPIIWNVPTCILYGEHDNLTFIETVSAFAKRLHADLTVMPGGEHLFHTKEQMQFLDNWIKKCRETTYSEPIYS